MVDRKVVFIVTTALALSACKPGRPFGALQPGVPLSKAEIEACLASPHQVGDDLVSPFPKPRHVFKPGYNFRVKLSDGSYGFGYEEASDGHLLVKYPKQGTSFDYVVTRVNDVVYFGEKKTSCK